jgi:formylglycine-generating enzyme required for sulfatase activity
VAAERDARRAGALHADMAAAFSAGDRKAGEALRRDELGARDAAEHSYLAAERSLETAIAVDPTRGEVRARFGEILLQRALLAERYHRAAARDALLERLALYDADGALRGSWDEPAQLSLTVTPSGAEVAIERYIEDARGDLHREPIAAVSPLFVRLAPGSYIATLTGAGLATVHYPIALARGETLREAIDVPPASAVPDGFVYIPPGRFLFGSALDDEIREVLNAPPLHEARTGGYLIAVHEVTTAEFIAFLDAQPGPAHDFRSEPRDPEHAALRRRAPGVWEYHFDFASAAGYTAQSGEPFRYRQRREHAVQDWMRFPMVGISALDAEAYVAWLARTRLPGARLCSELEWERAARGADGREYPHGRSLAANDANFADTYANKVDIGPDEVGLHPASRSPFGLDDMAGNAWEYTRSVIAGDRYIVRGGSFPNGAIYLHSAVRSVITETFRGAHHGLRVCAPAPAHVPLH